MRATHWILISAIGGVLVSGAGILLGMPRLAGGEPRISRDFAPFQEAQVRQSPVSAAARPIATPPAGGAPVSAPPAVPAATAPTAPAAPQRIETTAYDSWVVTCEDTIVAGATKRACVAALRVMNQNQALLLNWQIGFNEEGRLVTAVHIPSGLAVKQGDQTVGGAISIPNGVELKFGNGAVRRLSYVLCGPQQCFAEAPIDEAFRKEAVASANATITVHTSGGAIPFDLAIKGIDKAITIASARK